MVGNVRRSAGSSSSLPWFAVVCAYVLDKVTGEEPGANVTKDSRSTWLSVIRYSWRLYARCRRSCGQATEKTQRSLHMD